MSNQDLSAIQRELVAPKGQTNAFGGYKYRSCEDIMLAVKPLLAKAHATLNVTDSVVMLGDRFYVKATATITFADDYIATATGFAREALSKKGMDEAQITGAASSYARKYALNGLLAIDDTKDADAKENSPKKEPKKDLDPKIIKSLADCDSLDKLREVWDSISKSKLTSDYAELKNKAKKRLT
jgi:hypothetical protein